MSLNSLLEIQSKGRLEGNERQEKKFKDGTWTDFKNSCTYDK